MNYTHCDDIYSGPPIGSSLNDSFLNESTMAPFLNNKSLKAKEASPRFNHKSNTSNKSKIKSPRKSFDSVSVNSHNSKETRKKSKSKSKASRDSTLRSDAHVLPTEFDPLIAEEIDLISENFLSTAQLRIKRQVSGHDVLEELEMSHQSLTEADFPTSELDSKLSNKNIHLINLSHNQLKTFPQSLQLQSTAEVNLRGNFLREFHLSYSMKNLTQLILSSNNIKAFPSVEIINLMPFLSKLSLDSNRIFEVPIKSIEAFIILNRLSYLNLSFNRIKRLPDKIGDISSLKVLKIAHNVLERLPSTITELKLDLESGIDVTGNLLTVPPQMVATQGFAAIKRYFVAMKQDVISNQFKLIVVGHETAGKTSCVKNLTKRIVKIVQGIYIGKFGRLISKTQVRNCTCYVVDVFIKFDENYSTMRVQLSREDLELCSVLESEVDVSLNGIDLDTSTSTVGIDIDMWKPFMIADLCNHLMKEEHTENESSNEVTGVGLDSTCIFMDEFPPLPAAKPAPVPVHSSHSSTRRRKEYSPAETRATLCSLELSIWDFAGQDIYHAAQEAFFSRHALYMIVWDMTKSTPSDFDTYVQYWIDLIQIRAPGSDILIVATRADKLFPSCDLVSIDVNGKLKVVNQQWKELSDNLFNHLKTCEASRKKALKKDLYQMQFSDDNDHRAFLEHVLDFRPKIRAVVPVSSKSLRGYDYLTKLILNLSTPKFKNKRYPFQMVNISIPKYYYDVSAMIDYLIANGHHFVTLDRLHNRMCSELGYCDSSNTQDALAFLSCTGKVVWFGSKSKDKPSPDISLVGRYSDYTTMIDSSSMQGASSPTSRSLLSNEIKVVTRSRHNSAGGSFDADEGEDEDRNWTSSVPQLWSNDLSEYIFLSPHWLLHGIKGILSHKLASALVEFKRSLSDPEIQVYFPKELSDRGILSWKSIEWKLLSDINSLTKLEAQKKTIHCKSPNGFSSQHAETEHENKYQIAEVFRSLLINLKVIIPIRDTEVLYGDSANPSSSPVPKIDVTDPHSLYIVPSLLDSTVPQIPVFATTGTIKLERKYYFHDFVPPGLLEQVMGKCYLAFRHCHKYKSQNYLLESNRNCWRRAFFQNLITIDGLAIDIWVWLEESTYDSQGRHSKGVLHVAGYGHYHYPQEIIKYLDIYCDAVANVLHQFPGLCHILPHSTCPLCIWAKRKPHQCGEFGPKKLAEISDILNNKCSYNTYLDLKGHRLACSRYQCGVHIDQVLKVPEHHSKFDDPDNDLVTEESSSTPESVRSAIAMDPVIEIQLLKARVAELEKENAKLKNENLNKLQCLEEENCRLTSRPLADVKGSICKITFGYSLTSYIHKIKVDLQSGNFNPNQQLMLPIIFIDSEHPRHASGCIVAHDKTHIIITCEHFVTNMHSRAAAIEQPPGCTPVFLIGKSSDDEPSKSYDSKSPNDCWLYIAEAIERGSAYKNRMDKTKCCGVFESNADIVWDVCALSILCPIEPIKMSNKDRNPKVKIQSMNPQKSLSKIFDALRCSSDPLCELDQPLSLLSYPLMRSLAVSRGAVVQKVNGMLLVSLTSAKGSSGGAVVDRDGELIGVLSMSHTERAATYVEYVADMMNFVSQHKFVGDCHDVNCGCENVFK